jgi:hypothetical protein
VFETRGVREGMGVRDGTSVRVGEDVREGVSVLVAVNCEVAVLVGVRVAVGWKREVSVAGGRGVSPVCARVSGAAVITPASPNRISAPSAYRQS